MKQLLALILLCALPRPGLGQVSDSGAATPEAPAESVLNVTSDARVSPGGAATPDEPLDPELAAAIAADASANAAARPMAAASPASGGAASALRPNLALLPDISFILDVGAGVFSRADHIRQGGHALDETGVSLQGLEFAATGSVDPYFRYDMYFELGHLHLEEAFLTTLALPASLQARAGRFNAAFGRHNPRHLHVWTFSNPALVQTRFMSEEHFSGLGGELSYLAPLPWYLLLQVQVFDTRAMLRSASFAGIERSASGRVDALDDFVYVGHLQSFAELGPDWSLALGASAAFGRSPYVADNRAALYGADLYLKWRPVSSGDDAQALALTIEYLLRDTQLPGDWLRDHGAYAQLDAQLNRYAMLGLRLDWTDVARDSPVRPGAIPGRQVRGALSATWLPSHFSKLRLQYDVGQAAADHEQEPASGPYHAVLVQLEVSAGAHGAHAF